jgi:hypothetical protein
MNNINTEKSESEVLAGWANNSAGREWARQKADMAKDNTETIAARNGIEQIMWKWRGQVAVLYRRLDNEKH